MAKKSAGILLYRWQDDQLQVLLVHPGGPYWVNKDAHGWSIPKGEFNVGEDPLAAALREFTEETGAQITGDPVPLPVIRASASKDLHTFILQGAFDPQTLRSNLFEMVWPPKSGLTKQFPEVDKAAWFELKEAAQKLHKGQVQLLDLLTSQLGI